MRERNSEPIFRYLPAATVTVGKTLLVKGRGEGIVRGILKEDYDYLTSDGESAHIRDVFRVCIWFGDNVQGACLNKSQPTDFVWLPGWGTYLPRNSKENPWRELR